MSSADASASAPLLHHLTLVTPWFECTRDGRKKMEGRMRQSVPLVQAGDYLRISHATTDTGVRLRRRVTAVRHHVGFPHALAAVPLADALPGVGSAAEGATIYEQFYPAAAQLAEGVVWIETEPLAEAESAQAADAADAAMGVSAMTPAEFEAALDARRRMRSELEGQWAATQPQPSVAAVTSDSDAEADAEARAQRRQIIESFVQERMDQLHQQNSPPPRRALSLWLQPAPGSDVARKLEASVAALSAAHGQAPFPPHVTLVTFPWAGEAVTPVASMIAGVERALASVLSPGERSLRVHGSLLATHPSLPFVTLVLLLERSPALLALRTAIFQQLEEPLKRVSPTPAAFPRCFPYMPHLSLLYDTLGALSPLQREHVLERECAWTDGQRGRGREAFRGLEFDIGTIALVETSSRDYGEWPLLGSVALPTGLDAQMEPVVPLPPEAVPPCPSRDEVQFRREVLDRLDHALYLRLCFARAAEARARFVSAAADATAAAGAATPMPTGAALVCDGQVVWSACGRIDPSTGEHESAEFVLLHETSALDAASSSSSSAGSTAAGATAAAVPFFSPTRLARMVLYCSVEPCASASVALASRGIRSVVFGLSQSRLQQMFPTAPVPSSSSVAHDQPSLLRVGPLLEDAAADVVSLRSL